MKKFLYMILASAFIINTSAIAQIHDGGGHGLMQINTKQNDVLKELNGTPYLYKDYIYGTVYLKGKEPLQVYMRYDVNAEIFEIKPEENSEDIYVLPLNTDTKYHLGAETYNYRTINFEGKDKTGYFQIHYDGNKVSLLEKPYVTITEAVKAKTGYDQDMPGEIVIKKDFYLIFKDGTVKEVRLREKDFEKVFSSSKAVKKYLSENKLKTVEDFTKMLSWYDSQGE